jgi:hypothetical protein
LKTSGVLQPLDVSCFRVLIGRVPKHA